MFTSDKREMHLVHVLQLTFSCPKLYVGLGFSVQFRTIGEPPKFRRQRKGDDLARVFCSELVGAAYQRLKLLGSYPHADSYSPRDFSSDPGASLRLLDRVRLSGEEYFRR